MRVLLLVCDSFGVGAAPDAERYGDAGANTIGNTARAVGGLGAANLAGLGLGLLTDAPGLEPRADPGTGHGRMRERSAGKDTTTGHWELAGLIVERPFPLYPEGFPPEVMERFERATGRGTLGNRPASGTEIIAELGEEHLRTGKPIVYTSGDSVFQIAAHKDVVPLAQLYEWCRVAREILDGEHRVGRVIARPFEGEPGTFTRTHERRDYSVEPFGPTYLDLIEGAGVPVYGVGKIPDIFAGHGLTDSEHTESNMHGVDVTIDYLERGDHLLVVTNLVDFDTKYGHRNDPDGYARCVEEFDARLPELIRAVGTEGALFLTGDHGCDPTDESTDHTREHTPVLAAGGALGGRDPVDLGTRETFADLGATVADLFGVEPRGQAGMSFARELGLRVTAIDPRDVVARKRDGQRLGEEQIRAVVLGYARGDVPDYLASAFLMAAYIRGLDRDETVALTRAMVESGITLPLEGISRPTVDKHSTGGVADGVTLVFAPLAASLGLAVAKLSGRGLGHTGGTLDKLESIPGFRTDLSPQEMERQVDEVGCAVAAQTSDLVPADGALYALRDATATVPSVPLIAASVMSKKLAVGTDLILLDVKAGSGAFMKTVEDAEALAEACAGLASGWGRRARVAVTDMSQPLGEAVGNALDVAEAVEVLRGDRRGRLGELTVEFAAAAQTLLLDVHEEEARSRAERTIASGDALDVFRRMVEAQGGDPAVVDDPGRVLPAAPTVVPIPAPATGSLAAVEAEEIGRAAVGLGAGRATKEEAIDPATGIVFRARIGDRLERGEPIGEVHARDEDAARVAIDRVGRALSVSEEEVAPPPLVYGWRDAES